LPYKYSFFLNLIIFAQIIYSKIKYANAPKITKGTTVASQDLGTLPVLVVTPFATEDYELSPTTKVTDFKRLFTHLSQMKLI
jgi:hypothetical protein